MLLTSPWRQSGSPAYLPEHNPLYLDLYVHEYLHFIGKLYGMRGAELKNRVAEMVERCGLTREQNKRIESLSKGYRQRVLGLPRRFFTTPGVLILDEPTTGLDPNQLTEIRKLIKDVSQDKTVIFSTHIMQEVQALCDRVVVINKGRIVADDHLENVLRHNRSNSVVVEFEGTVETADLEQLAGVLDVQQQAPGTFLLSAEQGRDIRPEIFRFAADRGLSLVGLRQEENSLESIFRSLTSDTAAQHSEN